MMKEEDEGGDGKSLEDGDKGGMREDINGGKSRVGTDEDE